MEFFLQQGFGLEQISFLMWDTLTDRLNDEIAVQEAANAEMDEYIATKRGLTYEPIVIERIDIQNFFKGSKPSLVEGRLGSDGYPAISVVADDSRPAPFDDFDQGSSYQDGVYVDIVVKASEVEGEEICNARCYRTADAVNNVLLADPTFGGAIGGLGTPSVFVSPLSQTSANNRGHGPSIHYQVARIEYSLDKLSPFG